MKYIQFGLLCYRAYRGDVSAALEVIKILRSKVKKSKPVKSVKRRKK